MEKIQRKRRVLSPAPITTPTHPPSSSIPGLNLHSCNYGRSVLLCKASFSTCALGPISSPISKTGSYNHPLNLIILFCMYNTLTFLSSLKKKKNLWTPYSVAAAILFLFVCSYSKTPGSCLSFLIPISIFSLRPIHVSFSPNPTTTRKLLLSWSLVMSIQVNPIVSSWSPSYSNYEQHLPKLTSLPWFETCPAFPGQNSLLVLPHSPSPTTLPSSLLLFFLFVLLIL